VERVHFISIRQLGQMGGSISSSARRNLSTISDFPFLALASHRYHRDRSTSYPRFINETASAGEAEAVFVGPAWGQRAGGSEPAPSDQARQCIFAHCARCSGTVRLSDYGKELMIAVAP